MNIIESNLLDKYVLFNGFYKKKEDLLVTPKNHLFIIYDIIEDDDYKYAIRSVKITRFEIWAKIGQLILLDEESQVIARTLYGKNKYKT